MVHIICSVFHRSYLQVHCARSTIHEPSCYDDCPEQTQSDHGCNQTQPRDWSGTRQTERNGGGIQMCARERERERARERASARAQYTYKLSGCAIALSFNFLIVLPNNVPSSILRHTITASASAVPLAVPLF